MAIETGINDKNNYQGKTDWIFYQEKDNQKFLKLIKTKLSSKNYSIYETKGSYLSWFLVKNDKYLGRIQFDIIDGNPRLLTSHGTIKGFYQLMFAFMLTKYDNIQSDVSLSTQAIKSYERLSKAQIFKVKIKDHQGIHDFDKSILLKYPGSRVYIQEEYKFLKEHFDDFDKRIQHNEESGRAGTFKMMFSKEDSNLDLFLFGPWV